MIWALIAACRPREGMTKEQAIKLAEQFIIDNGYTSLPPDTSKLSYELFDALEKSVDTILSRRRNTLHVKAFCISERNDRWDVGFLLTEVELKALNTIQRQSDLPGRAVIVTKDRKEISMAHKDPLFSRFQKL